MSTATTSRDGANGTEAAGRTGEPSPVGYTVLARRYRSRDFDEIVGQEPIVRTLRNAIASRRTAHAYLFSGTRGVGKTSMARILASALNLTDELSERDAIGEAILRGEDLDVIEIDGASNRGVDQARDLIASAGLSPSRCPFRIYIIDEVHMLTKEAFNALLKTMEEPPSHVKFILCTTEPHKVPATIQSRCQRFDFRALSTGQIAEQLDRILSAEGIEADGEVVRHVARLGNGSMRDALSLLDRLLSAGEARLTVELLEELLGLPDHTLIESLVDAVATGDAAAALGRADELLRGGATVDQALELLAQHLRTLLVASACGPESDLIDLAAESRATAIRQAERFDAATLVHLIALCDATARNARASAAARALFDAAVVRMALSERMADIATLLERGGDAPGPQKKNDEVSPPAPSREPVGPAPRRETTPAPDAAAPGVAVTEVKLDLDGEELWRRVLASASAAQQRRLGYLHFEAYDGRRLRLSIGPEGAAVSRWLQAQSDGIADLVHRVAGRRVTLELDVSACEAPERAMDAADLAEVERDPAVRRAMELFDAVVVDVETSETSEGAQ